MKDFYRKTILKHFESRRSNVSLTLTLVISGQLLTNHLGPVPGGSVQIPGGFVQIPTEAVLQGPQRHCPPPIGCIVLCPPTGCTLRRTRQMHRALPGFVSRFSRSLVLSVVAMSNEHRQKRL